MRRPTAILRPLQGDLQAPPAIRRRRRPEGFAGPAVMRGSWVDPDDVKPDAKKRPRSIEGWRCYCVLRKIRAAGGDITEQHIRVADWLRQRVDLARLGFSAPRELGEPGGHDFGPRRGPSDGAVAQATASDDVTVALEPFTNTQRRMLFKIVIENQSIGEWTKAESERRVRRMAAPYEQGKLVATLEILAKHTEGEVEETEQHGDLPPI